MKAVILAGGLGTRLSEETSARPKPMVEVGGRPILWHIMKLYSQHGIQDFIICLGYRGYVIKEYFANYFLHMSDVTLDLKNNQMTVHNDRAEPWRVTLVDTGEDSMTGGRLLRVRGYVENEDCFCMTYGDGLSNVDIGALITFHKRHGRYATLTAAHPPGRFGVLEVADNQVTSFLEKPHGEGGLINAGFFILTPKVFDYLEDDSSVWEEAPLRDLATDKQLMAYKHEDFFQPMDTLRDKQYLEKLWESGSPPWRCW